MKKHLSIIICTKDREIDLTNALTSISQQSRPINELIIVDGSEVQMTTVIDKFPDLPIKYYYVRPPGLTKQRNIGLGKLDEKSDWVGFLDDDVVLEKSCLE